MDVDRIHNNTATTAASSSPQDASSPSFYGYAFLSMSIQQLLQQCQEQLEKETATVESADASQTSDATASAPSSTASTASPVYGTKQLAQMMANLMMKNSQLQAMLAQAEQEIATMQTDMQNDQTKKTQEDFNQWKANVAAQEAAQAHLSRWQKFFSSFTTALDDVCKGLDKYCPGWSDLMKLEDKEFGGHLGLEQIKFGISQGIKYTNEGIGYAVDKGAEALSFGNDKVKILMEAVIPVIMVLAGILLSAGISAVISGLLSTGIEALEAVGEAEQGMELAEIADAPNPANELDQAANAENVPGQAGNAGAQSNGVMDSAQAVWNKLPTLSRGTKMAVFAYIYILQQSSFSADVAKKIAKGDATKEMAWTTALNISLGLLAASVGYQVAGSFMEDASILTKNLYTWQARFQALNTLFQGAGGITTGKIELDLSALENISATIDKDMSLNEGFTQITESQMQSTQQGFTSAFNTYSSNLKILAQAMPVESTAGAEALKAAEG